ncbi:hypothetical protein RQ744_15835 [Roseomonas mucosa]|uniref:hypothetical protein n=1 Tax=Roseomonas mucosa TaxID=207340 RepID=UPI001EF5C104|nr:hypothetical protein [Roseomonas mucosa]MCG7352161.1 hypothetical protein [Roseomonas mucosa]MCG7357489.1 hypothetical protein [Roseomonas mucosa]MDT8295450.1 hypothetical protein [Roseomonas mucosa]
MSAPATPGLMTCQRRRLGLRRYETFRAMPRGLRFFFMAAGGLEMLLVAFQLHRMAPDVTALATRLDDWHALARLTPAQVAAIGLIAASMACMALVGWVSQNIFRVCRDSLEGELFR